MCCCQVFDYHTHHQLLLPPPKTTRRFIPQELYPHGLYGDDMEARRCSGATEQIQPPRPCYEGLGKPQREINLKKSCGFHTY
ncbi:hypothetical protein Trydic_g4048 [Trypoxylus dichotomus]